MQLSVANFGETFPKYGRFAESRMSEILLTSQEAAVRLGIKTLTLYDWLSQSDSGTFVIRGQPTNIHYFQGGRNGQGRIRIASTEIDRLLSLMTVTPRPTTVRKQQISVRPMRHITAIPGRPRD